MTRSIRHRRLRSKTLGLALALSVFALPAAAEVPTAETALVIEPASTRAGIARVDLEIGDLRQNGDVLEGTYEIRVPLSPKENDHGRIVLHTSASLPKAGGTVTTATGSAVSASGQVHEVDARMRPDGTVRIRVVTPKRTLRFTSRFASH